MYCMYVYIVQVCTFSYMYIHVPYAFFENDLLLIGALVAMLNEMAALFILGVNTKPEEHERM